MKRRLILICAVMFLAALAVPAFAAVQNVKVSGDIESSWIIRDSFGLGQTTTTGGARGADDNQNYFNSIARVRVDADLTDNVSTTIRLLNERDWNQEAANASGETDVAIDLAYVTLKEMLYSPLTVTIGRQNLRYGNGLVVGDPDTNRTAVAKSNVQARDLSARKAFDAVKAVLNYDPLTIDVIYSKINAGVINSTASRNANTDDIDLFGVNASYKLGDKYNSMVEAYYFARIDGTPNNDGVKKDKTYVPGLRVATNPVKGLNLQGEIAWQRGNKAGAGGGGMYDNRDREAMAWQVIGNYALQIEELTKYAPAVGFQYTHYSGDKDPGASGAADRVGEFKEWDPMFEDQGGGKIYNVLFRATDSNIYNANFSVKPIEDVTLTAEWTGIYLDKKLPGTAMTLYQTGASGAGFAAVMKGGNRKHLGQEIDATLSYDYTEDVQLKLTGGVFLTGSAFDKNYGDKNASQMIASAKVTF